jgi:hypothetical protein
MLLMGRATVAAAMATVARRGFPTHPLTVFFWTGDQGWSTHRAAAWGESY